MSHVICVVNFKDNNISYTTIIILCMDQNDVSKTNTRQQTKVCNYTLHIYKVILILTQRNI